MGKGIFPQMSTPDIINALAGWGISVSPEQLRSPTSDFVEGVYSACLEQVTGLSYDHLREPVQNAIDNSQVEDKVCKILIFFILLDDVQLRSLGSIYVRHDE